MIIELKEYVPTHFDADVISSSVGEILYHNYKEQIEIEPPTFKTGYKWVLTSRGWVGHIPLNEDIGISLTPKVPLSNLFRMLEYAYQLKSFRFLDGLVNLESIQEFYERLANILAKRVLDRNRKDFYRCYETQKEILQCVRGRIDLGRVLRKPWVADIRCQYEDLTADIDENQILTWSLYKIARSGMCTERVLPTVRRAYRSLHGRTSLIPHLPDACLKRFYNRLNCDYEPMHALCRFFLEHSGPTHKIGDKQILPFLVNMSRLFELFVAEWLKTNLPSNYKLKCQERVNIGQNKDLKFDIDLVIYDTISGSATHVMDTKYKRADSPSKSDIAQIVTYSESKNCKAAILIYPDNLERDIDEWIGDNRVRNLSFEIGTDIDVSGSKLIIQIFS